MAIIRASRNMKPFNIAFCFVGLIFSWNASRALVGTLVSPPPRETSSVSQTKTNDGAQQSATRTQQLRLRAETTTKTDADVIIETTATSVVLPEPYACLDTLPTWFKDTSAKGLQKAIVDGSDGLTDKTARGHKYQHMYHRYVSDIVRRTCYKGKNRIRILEIGLGCAPDGGMINGTPGGSAKAWRYVFPSPIFDLELHIMEYDTKCAQKWSNENPQIAVVHTGDQGSKEDLERVVQEAGGDGQPFDMIIDDGSHLNHHQILTAETMIRHVAPGGILVIEDIQSSCKNWAANMGSHRGDFVGGTSDCMQTFEGKPTIYSQLVEWQKQLILKKDPFQDVNHIDIGYEAAILQKTIP